jgi:hypothetical protein
MVRSAPGGSAVDVCTNSQDAAGLKATSVHVLNVNARQPDIPHVADLHCTPNHILGICTCNTKVHIFVASAHPCKLGQ